MMQVNLGPNFYFLLFRAIIMPMRNELRRSSVAGRNDIGSLIFKNIAGKKAVCRLLPSGVSN